jgi:3-methyl-2-oxobutanoate hydroxymethyltransferase
MQPASGLPATLRPDQASTGTKAMHATDFIAARRDHRKLSVITCYDYTFARLLATSAVDALLVGDSAAMVMHGYPSTLYADVPMMASHTAAVLRGAPDKFVIADMPFLSFRKGLHAAMDAAHALMCAGASAVKLEGVDGHEDVIAHLVQSGIPVMGHIGLQPQSIHAAGGYRVQGRSAESAQTILRQAADLEQLGAFAIVLECVPRSLADHVTKSLKMIPTIGIGAGPDCDGQVLVLQDLLGMNLDFSPRFARAFGQLGSGAAEACASFDASVKNGLFPAPEESFE